MLELRPNCQRCDADLPPASEQAMICSYECTFCRDCVDGPLRNVCPNCGGGFTPRPIRPARSWRPTTGLDKHPPSTNRRQLKWSAEEIDAHVARIADIPPRER